MKHNQSEQTLIYIHRDIHELSEKVKTLSSTLKTIESRLASALATMEAKKNESTGK